MDVFELPDVRVLRRFVLQNRELHKGLGDAVGDNTLRRWHGSKYNRK